MVSVSSLLATTPRANRADSAFVSTRSRPQIRRSLHHEDNLDGVRCQQQGVHVLNTTEGLVQRAQQGKDADAFAALIGQYERTALAVAYATTGNATVASDVVQEAFLRAWQRLDDLKDPQRFGAWLGRIVRNLASDAIRRGPRPAESLDETLAVPAAGQAGDPQARTQQRETCGRIDDALGTLDELTRTAVVLRYYQDLSSKEIGELLDLSPAAVDMRLSRARAQLRQVLASEVVDD
jgi:RNA polymerase sigma-70 factor (ECF subfamily)